MSAAITGLLHKGYDKDETYRFIENAFRDGNVQTSGTAISRIMPPVSPFSPDQQRGKKRETVLDRLSAFFSKFFDISNEKLDNDI